MFRIDILVFQVLAGRFLLVECLTVLRGASWRYNALCRVPVRALYICRGVELAVRGGGGGGSVGGGSVGGGSGSRGEKGGGAQPLAAHACRAASSCLVASDVT